MLLVKSRSYSCFFCAVLAFQIYLATNALCMFGLCFSCLYFYMFVFFLSLFHSDLDSPVNWGSSGLLLFSCSLRYLFHCLGPLAFKLSPLCLHFIVLEPKLSHSPFETNTETYIFNHFAHRHSKPHMCTPAPVHTSML